MDGDPDPSTPIDLETMLAEVAAESGGELHLEVRHPNLGPIPRPYPREGASCCPHCGGTEFWYEHGDMYALCNSCKAQVERPDLV